MTVRAAVTSLPFRSDQRAGEENLKEGGSDGHITECVVPLPPPSTLSLLRFDDVDALEIPQATTRDVHRNGITVMTSESLVIRSR
ncbi:hypothetical protein H5410_048815 [Solanum commersonii]|uniref:Uncharacterized protein n=1 Tax=Solanum commersonii TaxID=4109 RepID=A0A9J5XKN8_SOLCO|nr:hypothetical protein H5410_048815 [Solanum commersonii]